MGRTSARAGARRSIFPMTGLSGAPAADTDTNLFSPPQAINQSAFPRRNTCCGSEKNSGRSISDTRVAQDSAVHIEARSACHFKNAIGEFFNPHEQVPPGKGRPMPPSR